jgi:NHL repeat
MIAKFRTIAVAVVLLVPLTTGGVAQAAQAPIKQVLSSRIGWEVDKTTKGNVCAVASGDVCQPGVASTEPGGFAGGGGIAVQTDPTSPDHGDLYVADPPSDRVQELSAAGRFVRMFGWEVDKTTKANICTAESGDTCQAGAAGAVAGQFNFPTGIAVDPSSGDIYVQDFSNARVEVFTESGGFLWMVGREVNQTKTKEGAPEAERNLCTAASHDVCGPGRSAMPESREHGAFRYASLGDNLLAVGGPEDLLYVGDEGRVEEFRADGSWAGEIPLSPGAVVGALAVNEVGDVYPAYEDGSTVLEIDPKDQTIAEIPIAPSEPGASMEIGTLALDAAGHLAVNVLERFPGSVKWSGMLFDASTGHLISEYVGAGPQGLSFGSGGELYAAASVNSVSGTGNEALAYFPLTISELVAELPSGAAPCAVGVDVETDATFDCTLGGVIDAWGVPDTEAWFQWGPTRALGEQTEPRQQIVNTASEGEEEAPEPVSSVLEGLRPNATYTYRLAAYDHNVKPPEEALISRPTASFTTPSVPPRIVGAPSSSFVKSASAVLVDEVNPENATTDYFFEYGQCLGMHQICVSVTIEACKTSAYPNKTPAVESNTYGVVGTVAEIVGLRPCTSYHYRLAAVNEKAQQATQASGGEAVFTTAPAPTVQAETGPPSAVTSTNATVSGTVDPGGETATYTFELGIDKGAQTQYGVVFSGSVPASTATVGETLALTGLQPGTVYAYRIALKSGYGEATGEPSTFTTAGLPSVLPTPVSLGLLPVPSIAFPKAPAKCKRGYELDKHDKCVKVKKKKKTSKRKKKAPKAKKAADEVTLAK